MRLFVTLSLALLALGCRKSSEDEDGDGVLASDGDCQPFDAAVFPGAPEVCNGVDDDCSGAADDGATDAVQYFADADGDGFGDAGSASAACAQPGGTSALGTDCDDADPAAFPGAPEDDCQDSVDHNCDGSVGFQDADEDGAPACADCDDDDATAFPGAPELCDEADNDCNGFADDAPTDGTPFYMDIDGDGAGDARYAVVACAAPDGYAATDDDCDDLEPLASPGGTEACDGIDNDCDGNPDDGVGGQIPFYADADADGYGDANEQVTACVQPAGYVRSFEDCDDTNDAVHPGAAETDCNDATDYNCDGSVGSADGDGDGFKACDDCDDVDPAVNTAATEACNEKDDDCDGEIDEAAPTWYADIDGDGAGGDRLTVVACDAPGGFVASSDDCDDLDAASFPGATEACDGADNDCDGAGEADADADGVPACADCDDADATAYPGALEWCDGADDDCDGSTDEGALDRVTFYKDADTDTYGDPANATLACAAPTGFVANDDDCDDATGARAPGKAEVCDAVDNDCDGVVDDGATDAKTWYADLDGDGKYGSRIATVACTAPAGFGATATDCNDLSAVTYPGAAELCDGLDNDCDGTPDDGVSKGTYFKDGDGDGYGQTSSTTQACELPLGYASASGDCNDTSNAVNPGAAEACNGTDDNCDGTKDEGLLGSGAACAATTCKDLHTLRPTLPSGSYYISPSTTAFQAWCDMTTNGGGWTLAAHFYDTTNLSENAFITRYTHNRWTDEAWALATNGTITAATAGPVPNTSQGAIDIDAWTGRWTDVRFGCNASNNATTVTHFAQVDGYTTTNGNSKLLGGAPNGRSYTIPASYSSFNQTTIWHDNEISGTNSGHYLCDTTNSPTTGNGSSQFAFCYTDHLNNTNASDYGDSIVALAFGSDYGNDSWSAGFTAECGNMGVNALQNTGTYWLWVR